MSAEIWGFIGVIIGSFVSIITTWINNKNAIKIQSNSVKSKKLELFQEFQRNNFLSLQQKLSDTTRLIVKANLEDLKHYKNTSDWKSSVLSPELDNEISSSLREISMYTERIDNETFRENINELRKIMSQTLISENYETSNINMNKLMREIDIIMSKLGELLRTTY